MEEVTSENTKRRIGRDAQRNNILAAQLLAGTVRTTLGPKGMDKMLVDSLGNVTVTNDGATILKEMHIEHPAAKMLVEIAKTQEQEVGDGTTTAVVLAGELLKQAEILLDQNIHPTVIIKGYRLAAEKSYQILKGLSNKVTGDDCMILKHIASTAMTGKCAENDKEHLSDIVVSAVSQISESNKIDYNIEDYNNGNYSNNNLADYNNGLNYNNRLNESSKLNDSDKADNNKRDNKVNIENIKIEKRNGGRVGDTRLIHGIVIDKEKVHSEMPKSVADAKIALLDIPLEINTTEIDAKIQISSPEQMKAFLDQEERLLRQMVEKVSSLGVNVVFCQKGIDETVQHFLAKRNIYAVRRIKKSDMQALALATKGKICNNLDDLAYEDLGTAGIVREDKIGDEWMTFVEQCSNPKAVSILVRGGTEHVTAEVVRALEDAIGDVSTVIKSGSAIAGAGSAEIALSRRLYLFAGTLSGKEQLAVQAFAKSMEIIPQTLAENAGLDTIDVLTSLRASNDSGMLSAGINVYTGKVMDAWEENVIEPLQTKIQAISSATEVAIMLLRIDDVIFSNKEAVEQ